MSNPENYEATMFGGVELVISGLPGVEAVKVKQLPIRAYAELARKIDDECAMLELCTDLSPEQIDGLSKSDHLALLSKAEELNLAPFSEWLERKLARAQRLNLNGKTLGSGGANSLQSL